MLTDHDLLSAAAPGATGPYRFQVQYAIRKTQRTVLVTFAILNGRDRHAFAGEYGRRIIGNGARVICVDRIYDEPTGDDPGEEA